jgi:hypothetical protein
MIKRKTRTTEIIVEQRRVSVIRKSGPTRPTRCEHCGTDARMVTLDEAVQLSGCGTVYREVDAGQLHFSETADGSLFICLGSLETVLSQSARRA